MKKTVSLMLTLLIALSILTGCSSAPDLTGVKEKFNEATMLFNETGTLVENNGWSTDEEMLETHNAIADSLNEINAIIEDPKQSKNIDVETLTADLDAMIAALKEYKAAVSVPYGVLLDLSALTAKYNETATLHTKVSADAKTNGWMVDKTVVAALYEIAETLEVCRQILEEPTVLSGSDITQADLAEYTGLLDELLSSMIDLQTVVSKPA